MLKKAYYYKSSGHESIHRTVGIIDRKVPVKQVANTPVKSAAPAPA